MSTINCAGVPPSKKKKLYAIPKERRDQMSMLQNLRSSNALGAQRDAARYFRKLLASHDSPPNQLYLDLVPALVPKLIERLDCNCLELQLDCAWCLTNITCGGEYETHQVVQAGGCQALLRLMNASESNYELRDQAIWALSNIAGDCADCKKQLLRMGFLWSMGSLLNRSASFDASRNFKRQLKKKSLKIIIWALSNVCRGKLDQLQFEELVPVIPVLAEVLCCESESDVELLADACWCLAYIADGDEQVVDAVLHNESLCSALIKQLDASYIPLFSGALRSLGNLVSGTDQQTQIVIEAGVVPAFHRLLQTKNDGVKRETLWALSNISAGNPEQIQQVLGDESLLVVIIDMLMQGNQKLQREGAWALCNGATGGTVEHCRILVDYGVLGCLCQMLVKHDEPKLLATLLAGIGSLVSCWLEKHSIYLVRIVSENGGLDRIRELQYHSNLTVQTRAVDLWASYVERCEDYVNAGLSKKSPSSNFTSDVPDKSEAEKF